MRIGLRVGECAAAVTAPALLGFVLAALVVVWDDEGEEGNASVALGVLAAPALCASMVSDVLLVPGVENDLISCNANAKTNMRTRRWRGRGVLPFIFTK